MRFSTERLQQREVFPMGFVVSAPLVRRFFALGTETSVLAICFVIGAATSAMAQAGGGAVYAMTYLDVSTDWVLQGAGLIKQYRDTSRREAGNLEFTVLQETTRPNRFAIVEGWRDQKSMDAHAKGADARRFGFIPEAIRNSPPNQHVLEGFAIAPAKSAPAGAVYMIQHVDIAFNGFGSPVQAAFKALAGPSPKEAGALRYDVYEEPDPHLNHFSIVAAWTNEKAYEDHEAAPYEAIPRSNCADREG
jgi:quinol monooxygenase YgiN